MQIRDFFGMLNEMKFGKRAIENVYYTVRLS